MLEPGEKRPRTITRSKAATNRNDSLLAADYKWMIKDCPVLNYHLMVILTGDDPKSKEFAEEHFNDSQNNPDIARYMQIVVASDAAKLKPEDVAFMEERSWSMPQPGYVRAFALDSQGKELAQIDVEVAGAAAKKQAAEFVKAHIPKKYDAI